MGSAELKLIRQPALTQTQGRIVRVHIRLSTTTLENKASSYQIPSKTHAHFGLHVPGEQ